MSSTHWQPLAQQLTQTLKLQHAPLGITFSQDAPDAIAPFTAVMPPPKADGTTGRVPAGCVFWVKAVEQTFTTVPEDHYNCSVGSVTHGLKLLTDVMENEDVQGILEAEWVTPEEAMALPVVQERPNYITYGPLAEATTEPDVILLRINAYQAMVIHDAFSDTPFVGKPQCHIVPMAKEQDQIAISTGCMLSRIRTGMSPDELTCTIPASRLDEVLVKLEARGQANAVVATYASQDGQRFAS